MRPPGRRLLILHADERFVERAVEAAGSLYEVRRVGGWQALARGLGAAGPGALVLADPYHGSGRAPARPAPELRRLRHAFPSAVVIAAFSFRERGYRDIWTLSTWGVSDVLVMEEEGTSTGIRQLLKATRSRALRRLLESVRIPDAGRSGPLLDAAVEVVAGGGQVEQLARSLAVSRATLLRWCNRSTLPPPRRLLLWIRLLHAAKLLDDPGHSVLSVARACGYSSDNALRNALQKVDAPPPRQLRITGAFRLVAERFQREIEGGKRAPASNEVGRSRVARR